MQVIEGLPEQTKVSLSQRIGDKGEAVFVKWAIDEGTIPISFQFMTIGNMKEASRFGICSGGDSEAGPIKPGMSFSSGADCSKKVSKKPSVSPNSRSIKANS
jgi:hypothetical protein